MAYLDDVFRYAFARLRQREDAEDIAIEVVQSLPNPCNRRDLRVYMIGMARRKVADKLRRSNRSLEQRDTDGSLRFDARADESAMVSMTLAGLSEEYRELLVMKYVTGLSSSEIGGIVGKKASAIDSSLQKARDAFAKQWKGNETEVIP
jgi:RNA polymerase sigma-70 factor (ECF subfamily)